MWTALLLGAAAGGLAGVVGSVLAAALQLAARRARNRALLARGLPAYKDEVFRPMWRLLGPIGLLVGAISGGLGAGPGVALASGLVLPAGVALSALLLLRQGR
jgi:hypothetical protein